MLTIEMDMNDEKSVEKAFLRVKREVRGLDIVINCAGFTATNTKLQDTETEDFWKRFGVNVKGSYLLSRTFLTLRLPLNSTPPCLWYRRLKIIIPPQMAAKRMTAADMKVWVVELEEMVASVVLEAGELSLLDAPSYAYESGLAASSR